MNRIAQKNREKRVLTRVKALWSNFPDGRIECEDPPDFIVITPNDMKIGIELTTFYQDRDHDGILWVEQEGLRDKLCDLVENKIAETSFALVILTLHFRSNPLTKQALPVLVDQIIRVVQENNENIPLSDVLSIDIPTPSPVRIVGLMRSSIITKHSCKPINSGWVPTIKSSHIQSEISRKNEKVPQNRYGCDELILVIEIRGGKVSSYSNLDPDLETYKFDSTYNKCILFYDDRCVFELALA